MLTLNIPSGELYDETTQEFINIKEQKLQLEHSLVSLAKWESKWQKPFLSDNNKTNAEMIDYIRCMTITQNVDPIVYRFISAENIEKVSAYIQNPMSATWFSDDKQGGSSHNKEIITAEIIYYWMISFNIPVEFQKWHLNRLLTLIKVCSIKNAPKNKMKKSEILSKNKALNKARRKAMNSSG